MKLLDRLAEYLSVMNIKMRRWRRVISVMSAIVVFVTTYALVLPAITLDVDTASIQSGIEVATENEAAAAGTVFESTPEEEPEAEPAEEEPEADPAEDAGAEEEESEAEPAGEAEEADGEEPASNEDASNEEDSTDDAETASPENEDAQSGSDDSTSDEEAEEAPSAETPSNEEAVPVATEAESAETAKTVITEETPLITEKTQLTYKENDKDYVVYADFDESAKLPVGVELKVREITKEDDPDTYKIYYDKALEGLKDKYDENTGLSFARFYDIAFVFEGQEIEPKGNVAIKIEYKEAVEIKEETKVDAIHFDEKDVDKEEMKAEIIDSEKEVKEDEDTTKVESVGFESDKFSVYGVVGAETFTAQYLTEDGETYNISVTAGAEAHIPSDAKLEISEVKEGSDKYDELFAKAEAAVTDGKDASVPYARFFDIAIVSKDGEKIQPDAPVEVKITFDETVEAEKNAVFNAVHIADDDADAEVIDVNTEGDETDDAVTVEAVRFAAEGFSYYGVTYTVDFKTKDGGTFSMLGGTELFLSELIEKLGLSFDISEVKEATFTDEKLLNVKKVDEGYEIIREVEDETIEDVLIAEQKSNNNINAEMVFVPCTTETVAAKKNDWLITSLRPFSTNETLTIKLSDNTEYEISVTDAYETITQSPIALEDYATMTATIDGTTVINDAERNASFEIKIGYSFDSDAWRLIKDYINDHHECPVIEYDFSAALANSAFKDAITGGTINLTTATGKLIGKMTVDSSGKATIQFTNLQYLLGQSTGRGKIEFVVETDKTKLGDNNSTTISFPGTTTPLVVNYKDKITVKNKTINKVENADGSYTLNYTAGVTTTDSLTTLSFIDTMTGEQTLNTSSVKVNGQSVFVTQTNSGFTLDMVNQVGTGGTLPAGTYTVTYSTVVSKATLDALEEGGSTTGTNSAKWTANGGREYPGGSTEYRIDKPVKAVPIEKNVDKTSANGGETVSYTITYGDGETSLAGFRIIDKITDVYKNYSAINVSYNGTSTTLTASDVATDSSYSTNEVTLFDHTFPNDLAGTGPVTVTYTAQLIDNDTAKANNIYGTINAKNTAQEGKSWKTDGTTTIVEYPPEPSYSVDKTAVAGETDEDGNWLPGSTVTYTIVINADQSADMSNVVLSDVMTDLQKLNGNITIRYGSTTDTITAEAGATDNNYSTGNTTLFNYIMPSDAGKVAVTIVYTTLIADEEAAAYIGVFGNVALSNTAKAGSNSDGTNGTVPYEDIPFDKVADYNDSDTDDNGSLTPGSEIHYTVTYGSEKASNDGLTILDQINDIQKLKGDVSITLPKLDQDVTWPDGTVWTASTSQKTYTMPIGSSGYAEDGVVWDYFSDGSYNPNDWARVFQLKLPNGIGAGEITVEYDVVVITEEEALANGITGLKNAQNKVTISGKEKHTDVPVQFEEEANREPTIVKEFANADLTSDRVYWNIYINKTEDSAFPLYDITIGEGDGYGNKPYTFVQSTNTNIAIETSMVDWLGATITTESGIVLQAGVDYTIDKANGNFHFEQLDGPITIMLPINSPQDIINTYLMHNVAYVKYPSDKWGNYGTKNDDADYTYQSGDIDATKTGVYDEENRRIKWTVLLNPTRDKVDPDSINVWFSDSIPDGLTLLNYDTYREDDPTISVFVNGDSTKGGPEKNLYYTFKYPVTVDSNNVIEQIDIAPHSNPYDGSAHDYGLSYVGYTIEYYTKISDSEWAKLTSSLTGAETFTNNVTFTTSDGKEFDAEDEVTVEYNRYVIKTDDTNQTADHVIIDEEGNPSNVLSYTIQINPDGMTLNNNDALTLTDYIDTNMDLDTDTVKLVAATGTELSPDEMDDLGITISYDDDTRYLTISGIPDNTAYVLTYDALAKGKGTDTYTNTAVLIGGGSHSSKTEEEHTVEMVNGSFVAEGVSLGLKKVDQYTITKSLRGAEFELYKYYLVIESKYNYQSGRVSSAADNCDNPWLKTTTYNGITYYVYDYVKIEAVINGTYSGSDVSIDLLNEDFAIDKAKEPAFNNKQTTDDNGELTFGGLVEWSFYYWLETKAPDGYTIYSTEPHNFVLFSQTDGEESYPTEIAELHYNIAKALDHATSSANDLTVATYANEGTWVVTNVEDKYTYVSVNKVWQGDSDDLYETRPKEGIQVNLYQIDEDGNETLMTDLSPVSINVSEAGTWNTYTWNKLPATYTDVEGVEHRYKYTVKEVALSDYTTTYSDNGEGVEFGIVTVTNTLIPKYTSIYVKKEFEGNITNFPGQILVDLYVIKTDLEGVSSAPEPSGFSGALTADSGWCFSWDKLPTKDDDENKLTYTVVENLADLKDKGFNYSVVYSDNNEGVFSSTKEDPLVITNTPRGSVQVTKVFDGLSTPADEIPEDFQITNDYNDSIFTVNNATSGSGTTSDPYVWVIEDVAVGTEVTFTESGVTVDGYSVTITANGVVQAEGSVTASASAITAEVIEGVNVPAANFVNTYVKNVLEVTKIWKNNQDDPVAWIKTLKLTLHKGSSTTYEYTVSESEKDGVKTYSAVSSDDGAPEATVSGDADNGYKIVFLNLDGAENYYVTESKVDGYANPEYARLIGEAVTPKGTDDETAGKALDGEYIINRPEDAVTLPSTGGHGTRLFYGMGISFVAMAGLLLFIKRKSIRDFSEGRW